MASLNFDLLTAPWVSAVAALALLFIIGQQVRSAIQTLKANAVQSLTAAIATINATAISNPEVGLAVRKASANWDIADREQQLMAHYFLFTWFKIGEQAWQQNRKGVLDKEIWQGWQNSLARFYHCPGVKNHWWLDRRVAYSRRFVEFIEGVELPEGVHADGFYDVIK